MSNAGQSTAGDYHVRSYFHDGRWFSQLYQGGRFVTNLSVSSAMIAAFAEFEPALSVLRSAAPPEVASGPRKRRSKSQAARSGLA